ncbi:peptidoglycan/LPS O-acetylase OafA/YrhL [Novosphingobium chloroacetimidivorans]|uniref:Peptidoglycan/LPS O-acetylase OafA/YrhL n=1 Tax=Novosphingobium chloroacetimidivorans TaxID=1428314 RepID=A0A7W7KAP2_9SPHN|nr:acyltransferase [Novosphingobium chloroacetimidivorans]MBB4859095.1 peptidoglycan/LPS O-acetylase OafA/YrhL [Novosphingobium chloroacetimidivorans]
MIKALPEALPRADGRPPARYVTLDGMRGVAAIAVALFHFDIYLMPHGYVAVDFFFVLSGFVLYRSYLPRFREGLGIGRFMAQRLARLYPLFLLGLMLGLALALQQILVDDPHAPASAKLATTMLFNGLMLPSPAGLPYYPLNVPSWSLFFEIVANLALIVLIFRLPRLALVAICVVSAMGMAPIILDNGSGNIGALWGEHGIAFMRTAFSFTLGVIIAMLPDWRRAAESETPRASGWLGVACIAAIGVLLALPVPKAWIAGYDLAIILVFSPVLVYLGSRTEPVRFAAPAAAFVGEVSYALYAVHWSFIEPMRAAVRYLRISPLPAATLFLAIMLTAAWAAVRWYDLPLRRRLTAMLRREARGARPLGA